MNPIGVIIVFLRIYEMMILMRIIISWVPMDRNHPVIEWLVRLTDPVLQPVREFYMRIMDRFNVQMPLDLSPIVIFILIGFLERTLAGLY
jgi:YggT family protein